jgi:hypothetical protein
MGFTIKKDDFTYSRKTKNQLEGDDSQEVKFAGGGL